jgi:hypothetical protein
MPFPAFLIPFAKSLAINAGKNILSGNDPLKNAGSALISGGIGGFGGTEIPGAEVATSASDVSSIIPGSIESSGMLNVGGTFYDPSQYIGESIGNPIYTGGQGLLSNLGDEASSALSNIAPENLTGLSTLLNQPDTSQYRQMAGTGGGGVSRGQLGQSQPLSNVAVNRRKMNIWA